MALPLVSCIMPTYNRRQFVPQAIKYFLRQDYPHKELIILDDGTDKVRDLVPDAPEITYLALPQKLTVGEKRNLAIDASRGEIIVHWDDDDWMHERRMRYQVEHLLRTDADVTGVRQVLFYDLRTGKAWLYEYPAKQRPWLYGGSLCYRKAFWAQKKFAALQVGEDTKFMWTPPIGTMVELPDCTFYVAMIHHHNTSGKALSGPWWHTWKGESVPTLLQEDWAFYVPLHAEPVRTALPQPAPRRPTALVSAASGIGDILRVTPLIRVLARLGYEVDVLLAPDYPEVVTLLEGAPEIRRLVSLPRGKPHEQPQHIDGLSQNGYDIATFTVWSVPLQRLVRARRLLAFEQAQWLREGDMACVEKIARAVGWDGALPAPFALPSKRRFGLPPNTVALHPGCKPDWPWKKWHGFAELARLLPEVVIIGTEADLQNAQTYFREPFIWPDHAKNFVGRLSLPDTAALLQECAALVSNDSGMMQLGVALGRPTFGIFGITSPQREAIPAEHMFPITKGLPCEPGCRQMPWGRRDCEHHLQCLKTLTAQEVLARIQAIVPDKRQQPVAPSPETKAMDDLKVVYYGYVFDASGYGYAARAYIHSLHRAGITLSVVDLTNHARQVRDALVESLIGRQMTPDFHLFHGIPPQWARLAFRLPNAIGMTVWETDTMPTQWRNILNHVLDVWLPSEFNVAVFQHGLEKTPFRLPHPVFCSATDEKGMDGGSFLEVTEHDVVFYSIFEWQDRKSPLALLTAYLQAFPTSPDTVLIIKTNPGASNVAHQALVAARQQVPSEARVIMRCEAWSAAEITALHARGDCYVSLHRGEGWGYPLFEAACRGTPVIATGYAGPLDYLKPQEHHLVRYELRRVQQPYVYYHPSMQWAEPDVAHAVERLQWVYTHRDVAKEQATKAAEHLQQAYSLEAIGTRARDRLVQLLQRTQPQNWQRMVKSEHRNRLAPPVPIPGEWYDADYFETGVKSNWRQGYTWPLFAGLFQETATFLTSIFSEAVSYLDIGCATGFLVRTLREQGKECWGFDHSPWAIEHTAACMQPFIMQASVDDVSYDRQFDVLLALSVFESLTEEQAMAFLSRARHWTRQAIFATISSSQNAPEEALSQRDDGDLSHITIKNRQWWHEVFLRAGWRQDALHRIVERLCQTHRLPTQMSWQVYVYAPG
jgi:ADP-heptose:LPS heptosyltransferase/2-polyprenyl-3-methyl-5-hydroxy-6-metoxy-1,4-benzoquinol methylase